LIDSGIVVIDREGWMKTLQPKRCRGGVALAPGLGAITEIKSLLAERANLAQLSKPELARYFELRDSAVQQKKSIIVWVGEPSRWLPIALALGADTATHIFVDAFPNAKTPSVVVGRWNGKFHERKDIFYPGSILMSRETFQLNVLRDIRAALEPPPAPQPPVAQPTLTAVSQARQPAFQRSSRSC
jgi:hypothetical protein